MRSRIMLLAATVAALTCAAQDLQQALRAELGNRDRLERRLRELKGDMATLDPIQAKANMFGQNLANKRSALERSFETWMDVFKRNNPDDPQAEARERAAASIDKPPAEATSTTDSGITLDALKQLTQARAEYYTVKAAVQRELQQDTDLRNVRGLGAVPGEPVEPIRDPDGMMLAVQAVRTRLNSYYADADRALSACQLNIKNLERKISEAAAPSPQPGPPATPAVDLSSLDRLEQSIAAGESDLARMRGEAVAICAETAAKAASAADAEKAAGTALNVLRGLVADARGKTNSCTSRTSQVAELLAIQGKLAGWEAQLTSRLASAQAAAASCAGMTSPEAASKAAAAALAGLAACAGLQAQMTAQAQIASQKRAQLELALAESRAIFVSLAQAGPIADMVTGMADTVPGLVGDATSAAQRALALRGDYGSRRGALSNLARDFRLPAGAGPAAEARLSSLRTRAGNVPGMDVCGAAVDSGAAGRAVAMKAEAERLRGEAASLSALCRVQGDPIADFADSATYVEFLVLKGGQDIRANVDKCRAVSNPSQPATGQSGGQNNNQSGSGTTVEGGSDSDTTMESNGATDGTPVDTQTPAEPTGISLGGVSFGSSNPPGDPSADAERAGLSQAMSNAADAPPASLLVSPPPPDMGTPVFDPQAAAAEAAAQQAQRAQRQQQMMDTARNLGQMLGQTMQNRRATGQPPPVPQPPVYVPQQQPRPSQPQVQPQGRPQAVQQAGTPVSAAEKNALEAEINRRNKDVWVMKWCAARYSGCSILPDGVRANLTDVWLWEAKTREEVNAVRNLFQCSDGCVMSGAPAEQVGTCLQRCKETQGYKR